MIIINIIIENLKRLKYSLHWPCSVHLACNFSYVLKLHGIQSRINSRNDHFLSTMSWGMHRKLNVFLWFLQLFGMYTIVLFSFLFFFFFRTVLVAAAVLLAVAVPTISPFIGLIGAFCFSILGLLVPVSYNNL